MIFLLISTLLIINAPKNTLDVFIPGSDGVLPAFQGMIFCLLAFVGFEAVAPLGEEAREPRQTIPRAVIWSAVLVGLFYVFNYYAATVYFGPDKMNGVLHVQQRRSRGASWPTPSCRSAACSSSSRS